MIVAVVTIAFFAAAQTGWDAVEKQIAAGDYRGAIASLQQSAAEARDARWHLAASRCYDGLNDPANAVKEAQAAVELDPRSERARMQLAQIFLSRNTPEPAYEILSNALPLFPQSALVHLGLGLALNGMRRYDEAIQVLNECLRLRPGFGLAFDALANAYLDSANYDGLLSSAAAYRQANPGDFRGYYYEANARRELRKDPAETEKMVRQSLEYNPRFAAAHVLLGRLMLDSNRTEQAVRPLEEAVRLRPNYAPAHLYLALAYRRIGRADDARRESQEVSRINDQQSQETPHLLYHQEKGSAKPPTSAKPQ